MFAREVAEPEGRDKPFLVFLQGGPGFEASRPTGSPRGPGWLDRALKDFRVLMLDQRGTGRSTPVDATASADYLVHFRADSIVRDAELVREALGVDRWSVLGQSFGGLCVFTYLSLAPEGLREAFTTGGVPGIGTPIDDVYRATYARTVERNRRYFARFPEDRERMRDLVAQLDAEDVRLPTGDRLTSRRLRTLGSKLGMSDGPESVHYVLELPVGSPAFLHDAAGPPGARAQPDLRGAARGVLGGRRRDELERAADAPGASWSFHGRAHLSVDVRGVRRAGADAGGGRAARGA